MDTKFSAKTGMANIGLGTNYNYSSNMDNYNNINIDFTAINKEKEKKSQIKKPETDDYDFGGLPATNNKAKKVKLLFYSLG